MTQTVDSKWTDDIEVRTLNFLDVVDPPKNPNKDEFFSQLQRFAECVAPGIQPENGWLQKDKAAMASVMRGLSQVGSIDRGSFASYASE